MTTPQSVTVVSQVTSCLDPQVYGTVGGPLAVVEDYGYYYGPVTHGQRFAGYTWSNTCSGHYAIQGDRQLPIPTYSRILFAIGTDYTMSFGFAISQGECPDVHLDYTISGLANGAWSTYETDSYVGDWHAGGAGDQPRCQLRRVNAISAEGSDDVIYSAIQSGDAAAYTSYRVSAHAYLMYYGTMYPLVLGSASARPTEGCASNPDFHEQRARSRRSAGLRTRQRHRGRSTKVPPRTPSSLARSCAHFASGARKEKAVEAGRPADAHCVATAAGDLLLRPERRANRFEAFFDVVAEG